MRTLLASLLVLLAAACGDVTASSLTTPDAGDGGELGGAAGAAAGTTGAGGVAGGAGAGGAAAGGTTGAAGAGGATWPPPACTGTAGATNRCPDATSKNGVPCFKCYADANDPTSDLADVAGECTAAGKLCVVSCATCS